VKQPWNALNYTYTIDYSKPYFLKKKLQVFNLTKDDVELNPEDTFDKEIVYADFERTTGQKIAADMSVAGCGWGFSGSASMAATSKSKSKKHTCRIDARVCFKKYECIPKGDFSLDPIDFMTEKAKKFILKNKPRKIVSNFGEFYTEQCALGGVFEKTYIMEISEEDEEKSLKAEVEASYDGGIFSVQSKNTVATTTRTCNRVANMRTIWHVEGGDSKIWMGLTDSNVDEVKRIWSNSIQDKNLFPFQHTLKPIWELIALVDPEKGRKVEEYLMAKWEEEKWSPTEYVPPAYVGHLKMKNSMEEMYVANGKDFACVAERGYHTNVDADRRQWDFSELEERGLITLAVDGRQLYKDPKGWVRVAHKGKEDNKSEKRRKWKLHRNGLITCENESSQQLYVNRDGWLCVAPQDHHSNTDENRRLFLIEKL
jgi:hypothetical protein